MKIRENLDILIDKHPHSETLNKKLILESDDLVENNYYYSNIQGKKKNLTLDKNSSSRLVLEWVKNLILNRYHQRSHSAEKIRYSWVAWFVEYNKGNSCLEHNHIPFALFSFVYFVNTPPGSSPLVFATSGKKIKAEAGKVIVFSSEMMHYVPKNKCDKRLVLAGNLLPISMDEKVSKIYL